MSSSGRDRPDRCPGILAVHQAADGGLARVRLPGGVLSVEQLRVLVAASGELGDGNLELTSRGNVQIRALRDGAPRELSDRLYAAGLLPSITHERVRNILASPLTGLDQTSLYDVLPLAAELDRLLCASPSLADLPGRFLFALDDGRGDLTPFAADVAVRVVPGGAALLTLGGEPAEGGAAMPPERGAVERGAATPPDRGAVERGVAPLALERGALVPLERVAEVMVAAAEAFLAERAARGSEAWRIAELAGGAAAIYRCLGLKPAVDATTTGGPTAAAGAGTAARSWAGSAAALGVHEQADGPVAVVVGVPLGSLGAEQAEVLADLAGQGNGQVRVTPWRSVVLAGVASGAVERLEEVGLVVEAGSPWSGVTACAGKPGCGKALADVRADARAVKPHMKLQTRAVHWSGCERRCGRPAGGFVDIVATGNGYEVDGQPVTTDLGEAVAQGMRVL